MTSKSKKQKFVRILAAQTEIVPLACNGVIHRLKVGVPAPATDEIISALQHSLVAFELTDEEGGAEGGVLAVPPSEPSDIDVIPVEMADEPLKTDEEEYERVDPLDHDHNGKKGGSLPKAKRPAKKKG